MADAQTITKTDLKESFKEFRKGFKKDVHEAIDERVPKIIDGILEKRMPIILGEFTEQVLLPSITSLIRQEIAKSEHRLKTYIDSKVADLRGDRELFRKFMTKTVAILRRHHVATEEEINDLSRLIPA